MSFNDIINNTVEIRNIKCETKSDTKTDTKNKKENQQLCKLKYQHY